MTCQIMKGPSEELPVLVILLGPGEDAGTFLEALGKDAERTTMFSRAASVSGSLWYDGFPEYCGSHSPAGNVTDVYFSLGSKESRTKNPRMAKVEDSTRAIFSHMEEDGIETVFEINSGNHFQDPCGRMAKGIRWLLRNKTK